MCASAPLPSPLELNAAPTPVKCSELIDFSDLEIDLRSFRTVASSDVNDSASSKMYTSCETQRRLAEQFSTAARLYAEAVTLLVRFAISQENYEQLREAVKTAHQRSDAAGRAFEEHVDLHGCYAVKSRSHGS